MSVTESAHSLGAFSLVLSDETPDRVWSQLGYFGHVAIFDGPVDVEAVGDNGLRSARYVGVLRQKGKPNESRTLGGNGMLFWLGDEDGKGAVIETALTFTSATFAAVVAAVLPPAVTLGVIHTLPDPAARYTGTHQWQSPRQVLDIVCDAFGVEYRVNGDATIDFGTQAQLYRTLPGASPAPLVVKKASGEDTDIVAVGADYDTDNSGVDYSTRIVLLGQTTDAGQFATGSINAPTVPYVDMHGNPVKFTRLISESSETTGSVAARAQLQLNRYNRIARSLDINPTAWEMSGSFFPGDDTFVFDEDAGIVNPAYEVVYHGQVIHPDIIRVTEMTYPVVDGMTIGFRTSGGVWIDLTPFVTYETGQAQLIVGDLPYSLSRPSDDPFQLRADQARGQTPADTTIPGVPGNLVLATSGFGDSRGGYHATLSATWNVPLNTDSSVMTDLDYYVFRYRPTGRPAWSTSYVNTSSIEVQAALNTTYEAQVAAVDTSGHTGAFTASQTIITSIDTVAPPPPADPTVTAYLGMLRVQYAGTDNTGAAMPADTDFVRAEVASATTGPWTNASFSDMNPFIPGVAYVDAPYGSPRFVRLLAVDRNGNVSAPSGVISGSTVKVADGDIASMSVGKLIAGTILVDIVNAARIMSGTVGQRYELNAAGLQMWNSAGTKTVDLNGASNLITGTLLTGLAGTRHVEIGASGASGSVNFFAPDGTLTTVTGFTSPITGGFGSGAEAIQIGKPVTGATSWWNSLIIQANEVATLASRYVQIYFGGSTSPSGSRFFEIIQTPTFSGGGSFAGQMVRFLIDDTDIYLYNSDGSSVVIDVDDSGIYTRTPLARFQGASDAINRVDILPYQASSGSGHSWGLGFVTNNNFAEAIRYYDGTGGGVAQVEVVNYAGSAFSSIGASAFTVSSDARTKKDIVPFDDDALAMIRSTPIRRFTRKIEPVRSARLGKIEPGAKVLPEPMAKPSDPEIGIIAQELPEALQLQLSNGLGTSITQWMAVIHRAVQQLADRIDGEDAK